jgi:hypothetical protein
MVKVILIRRPCAGWHSAPFLRRFYTVVARFSRAMRSLQVIDFKRYIFFLFRLLPKKALDIAGRIVVSASKYGGFFVKDALTNIRRQDNLDI